MKSILHEAINKRNTQRYIRETEKNGGIMRSGKFIFDLQSLLGEKYECNPALCLKKKKSQYHGSCCTDYSVDLSKKEENAIRALLKKTRADCEKEFPWVLTEKVFVKNRDGSHYLEHRDKNNTCVLSVVRDGVILCVIDILVKKYGLKRTKYKPSTCFSWPFHCVRTEGKILVSSINNINGPAFSQDTACLPCVSGKHGKSALESLKEQFSHYLSGAEYKALLKKSAPKPKKQV
jgi:hypothetical protein